MLQLVRFGWIVASQKHASNAQQQAPRCGWWGDGGVGRLPLLGAKRPPTKPVRSRLVEGEATVAGLFPPS